MLNIQQIITGVKLRHACDALERVPSMRWDAGPRMLSYFRRPVGSGARGWRPGSNVRRPRSLDSAARSRSEVTLVTSSLSELAWRRRAVAGWSTSRVRALASRRTAVSAVSAVASDNTSSSTFTTPRDAWSVQNPCTAGRDRSRDEPRWTLRMDVRTSRATNLPRNRSPPRSLLRTRASPPRRTPSSVRLNPENAGSPAPADAVLVPKAGWRSGSRTG